MFNAISPELRVDILDQLPIPIYRCDKDGYVTSYNQAALDLWGLKPEAGKTRWSGAWKMSTSDGEPLLHNASPMARCLAAGIPLNGDQVIIERPDGSKRTVQSYPVPVFDENGELTGGINTLVDITETIRSEEKQARLAAIVDSSDDAIVSKTLGGIITSWNRSAERLFGYSEQEAIGRHISLIIPTERLSEEDYIIGQIINGNKVDHFETIRVTKSGAMIPLSISVSPIVNKDGVIIGASKIARDISDRKKAEERKKEFISLVSHELKTPITTIGGYMQLLEDVAVDEKSKRFVGKIHHQVKRLTQLVSDLLDVSEIEGSNVRLFKEVFDINKVLLDAAEFIRYSQHTHTINVTIQDGPAFVCGNPQRVEQVFINLFTNAIKYSPDASEIIVLQKSENDRIIISVEDFGIGIPANKLKDIFTRFYKISEFTRNLSGLGIGLYISSRIVEKHQGRLWVESEAGKGSTFFVELPIAMPEKSAEFLTVNTTHINN